MITKIYTNDFSKLLVVLAIVALVSFLFGVTIGVTL